jgi:hypothetical protein
MDMAMLIKLLPGGEVAAGCSMDESEAKQFVLQHFPGRPYCLVSDWVLIEIEIPQVELALLAKQGVTPALLYAFSVIHDSKGRFPRSHTVRTSLGVSFSHECLFETRNTVYVLMGPGRKATSKIELLLRL